MIYLDAAATTLEKKPPQVRQAMAQAAAERPLPGRAIPPPAGRRDGLPVSGRGGGAGFGVPSPENVVFTMNATHGLNIAIRSLVVPGSRVVISGYESTTPSVAPCMPYRRCA